MKRLLCCVAASGKKRRSFTEVKYITVFGANPLTLAGLYSRHFYPMKPWRSPSLIAVAVIKPESRPAGNDPFR